VFADTRAGHTAGSEARRIVAKAREVIASSVGCAPDALVFTNGGTEANALALKILGPSPIVSSIEHAAIAKGAAHPRVVAVGRSGRIAVEDVVACMEPREALPGRGISIIAASNETGILQPIAAIASEAHRRGLMLHTDAIQTPGRTACRVDAWGADLVTFSAHKIGAPAGTGLLVTRQPLSIEHVPSAENVAGILAMARAFELLPSEAEIQAVARTRDLFDAALMARLPDVEILGRTEMRLSNTTCVLIPGCAGEALMMALDVRGFAISTGSACSSGSIEASPILLGMGLSAAEAKTSARFSFARPLEPQTVESLASAVTAIAIEVRKGF
ncbi:MAG: aminotransferase class V-fold PLP-dependent enzyme, partial [Clostridia bacterium]|nr:aminotransferase class V-fold PLP-dependent enzyme [Deltaproteobacteria bacterium]